MTGIVHWPEVCGENDVFWDYNVTVNTTRPDLPDCFQDTVLVWVPAAWLWLILPLYSIHLYRTQTIYSLRDKTKLNAVKIILSLLLVLLWVVELVYNVKYVESDVPLSLYIKYAGNIASFLLIAILHHVEFNKDITSSGVIFIFWTLELLSNILVLASQITRVKDSGGVDDEFEFGLFVAFFSLLLTQFFMGFFADSHDVERQPSVSNGRLSETTPLLASSRESSLTLVPSQTSETKRRPCPEARAVFPSVFSFWWITSLLVKGYKKFLTFEDLPDILESDKAKVVYPMFESGWTQDGTIPSSHSSTPGAPEVEVVQSRPSLYRTMLRVVWKELLLASSLRVVVLIWEFSQPLLLQALIAFVAPGGADGPDPRDWYGYTLSAAMFGASILYGTTFHASFKNSQKCGMRLRSALTIAVYRKALRMSSAARQTTTVGEIVNLMSVDTQKIQDACNELQELWACPVTIAVALYLLWGVIGPSSMAGLAVLVVLVPINGVIMGYFATLQNQQMEKKDERLKSTSELLRGIKILKLYAWEPSFERSLNDIRDEELSILRRQTYINAGVSMAWTSTTFLVSLAVFATYSLVSGDHVLDAQKAFVSINIINILNWTGALLPMAISFAVQAAISVKRITKMLLSDEVDPDAVLSNHSQEPAVMINNGTFSWSKSQEAPTLKDISLAVEEGKLVGVVGQVGSGKSSLIASMLGELHKHQGTVSVKGSMAYVPQEAWIQNATLRDNILFGKAHAEVKYANVVEACALQPDFSILPAGDQTEIGEKGINLSGGQKQRVSVARAVYQNKDIYLLDDPLSAVDANVGKHLFNKVIGPEGLLKNKTRLLVTHGVTFLPQCDMVVVMREGRVSEAGSYDSLLQGDGAFSEFIKTYLQETEDSDQELSSDEKEEREKLVRHISVLSEGRTRSESEGDSALLGTSPSKKDPIKRRLSRKLSRQASGASVHKEETTKPAAPDKNKLIEEEEAAEGAISFRVVLDYMRAMGIPAAVGMVLSTLLYTGATIGTNIWLTAWSDDKAIAAGGPDAREHTNMRLGGYAGFGVASMIGVMSISLCLFLGAVRGSMVLHTKLLQAILRAPMSFFDTTPLGRILNRFSKDMDNIDVNVPMYMNMWIFHVAFVFATLVLICYSTPIFLVMFVPLTIVFLVVQRLYISSVRQLSRIDAIRRSPIYTNFDETLVGATCIRAFHQSERFIAKNELLVDYSQISYYPILICQRWLGFSLNTIGAFVVFFASLFAIIERNSITGGLAGMSVSYAQQTAMIIDMLVQASSDLETHFVSVERVKEYSQVQPEAPWRIEETRPAIGWPERGEVEFRKYSTRYRSGLDLVLKNLSFQTQSGERVGIVGRTGAGKSSVTLSLFRIIEAAGGAIHIDGVNVAQIGLHDLRTKLTIIPQDPVLFSGSLRRNLDPFNTYTDSDVWVALEHAHLKSFVNTLSEGLQYEVGEGGEALSVGQRQLVCLARALLRKTKILLLDEATAAVDLETDDLIQTTIRTEFKECTVLTIAHRLNTIMDYDRVMVLDQGEIKEYDSPSTLLAQPSSLFYGLAKDAGLV